MAPSIDEEIAALEARLQEAAKTHIPWVEQHAPIPPPQVSGLSKAQKALLMRLYRMTLAGESVVQWWTQASETAQGWRRTSETTNERSQAASQSRTLRRLAARGLLVRLNRVSGMQSTQATHVRLTEAGLSLAAQLSQENG